MSGRGAAVPPGNGSLGEGPALEGCAVGFGLDLLPGRRLKRPLQVVLGPDRHDPDVSDHHSPLGKAASPRLLGEAAAAGEAARIDVYRDLDARLLTALALNELAANLPAIDNLTITPDLLTDVIRRFGGAA